MCSVLSNKNVSKNRFQNVSRAPDVYVVGTYLQFILEFLVCTFCLKIMIGVGSPRFGVDFSFRSSFLESTWSESSLGSLIGSYVLRDIYTMRLGMLCKYC